MQHASRTASPSGPPPVSPSRAIRHEARRRTRLSTSPVHTAAASYPCPLIGGHTLGTAQALGAGVFDGRCDRALVEFGNHPPSRASESPTNSDHKPVSYTHLR